MNISDKSKQIIDSCRFCWMCRHICPIGNATGQERNTARARALTLSMVLRESVGLTGDVMDNVYECACCSACTKECATGWDPVAFVKEVRLKAAMEGKMPGYIKQLVENCLRTGNPYGTEAPDDELAAAVLRHAQKTDTLLFLGSDARCCAPGLCVKAIRLLEEAGVSFTVLKEEPDSGAAMEFLVGAASETEQVMRSAVRIMNDYAAVILYDPADAKVVLREYREWDLKLTARPVLFPSYVRTLLEKGKIRVSASEERITYQDSYVLARELEQTEDARAVIRSCGVLTEMLLNRRDTNLAGHLVMAQYMPEVILEAAKRRVEEAWESGAQIIVTASAAEYVAMRQAAGKLSVVSLEELVLAHRKVEKC